MSDNIEERVIELAEATYLEERLTDIEKRRDSDDGDVADAAYEEEAEIAYGITVVKHVEIILAGGGPSHYLDVELDSDNTVVRVTSVASWAGPEVKRMIPEGTAVFRYAEHEAELAVMS